ncbi:MAG: hypothetical protein AAF492_33575 [Verrucomicrobiota bacterium]
MPRRTVDLGPVCPDQLSELRDPFPEQLGVHLVLRSHHTDDREVGTTHRLPVLNRAPEDRRQLLDAQVA